MRGRSGRGRSEGGQGCPPAQGAEQLHRSRQPDHDEFPWGSHGWIRGFNAHALVEEGSGVIVAQEVSAQGTDSPRLGHVLARPDENLAGLGVPEG